MPLPLMVQRGFTFTEVLPLSDHYRISLFPGVDLEFCCTKHTLYQLLPAFKYFYQIQPAKRPMQPLALDS